ncbi:MAG: TRAP transporter substrate-binding protein [Aliidongia sp.]
MSTLSRRRFIGRSAAAGVAGFGILTRRGDAAEFTMKLGNNTAEDHPQSVHAKAAIERIRDESGGRVEIRLFANSQLGNDQDMLTQLRAGALEFQLLSPLILATLVPLASINGIGFAFKDYDAVWAAMDGDLGALVRDALGKTGLYVFDKMWDNGYRQVTTSTRPINTPEDLKHLKIRVPAGPIWTSMFQAFGAAPTNINFSEVYSALQTHLVEGEENPLGTIAAGKLYEVQKYCSMTYHMWDGYWLLANGPAWRKLPPEMQDIVSRNFAAAALAERAAMAALNASVASDLAAKGLVFNEPDLAPFHAALTKAGFYPEWKAKFGAEAWAVLEKYSGPLA